jgi:hypothetical protein
MKIECPICYWDWESETGGVNPYLCHKCGFDSKLGDFDEESLKDWEKENNYPFHEQINHNHVVRTFSENIDGGELVWHRDKEDRIVKSIGDTDWMIQIDNQIPKPLTEMIFIPKETYHRVIKGTGDLKVRVNKLVENEEPIGWMKDVPSDIDLGLYKFLEENFAIQERVIGGWEGDPITIVSLSGLDEYFNLTFGSKKSILNKIYWLIEDDFNHLEQSIIRRTIRKFLNEKHYKI